MLIQILIRTFAAKLIIMKNFNYIFLVALIISVKLSAQEQWIIKSEHLSKPDTVLVYKPNNYKPKGN